MGRKIENCILIVYGGESAEHDISIITALTIYKKYRLKNKQIKLLYQSRDGRWFIGDELTNFKSYKNFNFFHKTISSFYMLYNNLRIIY